MQAAQRAGWTPESLDPRAFHLALVRHAKKWFPYGWKHEVTQFLSDPAAAQWISRVIVDEFAGRYWQCPVTFTAWDLRGNAQGDANALAVRMEFAFMSLRHLVDAAWAIEVLPAEVPSGE
jgi:hypothetical protein